MKTFYKSMVVVGAMLLSTAALADFEDVINWFKGPKKDIRTIVITSNYTKSRLMADLIQNESRQPYILLPAEGQKEIFFCPVNPNRPALQITEHNFGRFISFANPQQVIVIGDNAYVPQRYLDQIEKRITVVVIPVKDWNLAARTIGDLMKLPNIASDYKRLNEKIEQGFYVPVGQEKARTAPEDNNEVEVVVPERPVEAAPKEPGLEDGPVTKHVIVKENETADAIKEPAVTPKAEVKEEAAKEPKVEAKSDAKEEASKVKAEEKPVENKPAEEKK